MGEGLKRVAKACGGIKTVTVDGKTYHFNADGKLIRTTKPKGKF